MDKTTAYTIDLMLGHSLTRAPVDNKRAVLAMRAVPESREVVLAKRREWLVWITLQQRKWQGQTRNRSKARHHDSVAIREKYVRGYGDYTDFLTDADRDRFRREREAFSAKYK